MNVSPAEQAPQHRVDERYVLMTAAHNEAAFIAGTIESIVAQTRPPERWVIVSDNSTDGTDEIIQSYAQKHKYIHFVRRSRQPGRDFSSKVRALHSGMHLLNDVEFAFIGNIDGDVSLEPSYFEDLINHFSLRPRLGIAAGFFFEEKDGEFKSRKGNRTYSITHAAQLVRRECFQAIGGYAVLEYGGEDWHAEITAKMKGWEIEAFPDLKIFHHRPTGTGGGLLRYRFRQGKMDYVLGSDPLFEFLKCFHRLGDSPLLIGGIARALGFSGSWISREKLQVSPEFADYLRKEQRLKIRSLIRGTQSTFRSSE
jgi:biofilm PGA synthesis N-glycosyltransferase PgaC